MTKYIRLHVTIILPLNYIPVSKQMSFEYFSIAEKETVFTHESFKTN